MFCLLFRAETFLLPFTQIVSFSSSSKLFRLLSLFFLLPSFFLDLDFLSYPPFFFFFFFSSSPLLLRFGVLPAPLVLLSLDLDVEEAVPSEARIFCLWFFLLTFSPLSVLSLLLLDIDVAVDDVLDLDEDGELCEVDEPVLNVGVVDLALQAASRCPVLEQFSHLKLSLFLSCGHFGLMWRPLQM